MDDSLYFKTRSELRCWLQNNCQSSSGVWLVFRKDNSIETITANEALEEALCFGWIDGVMKRVDDKTYIKYFSIRKKKSKWSIKNKSIVEKLEKLGLMTDFGRKKVNEAKKNGQWDSATKPSDISDEQIDFILKLIKNNELAYTNFLNMSLSIKKTYTRAYFDAKTDAGKTKRLEWLTARLEKNLKPM